MNIELLSFFIQIYERNGVAVAGREYGYSPATASAKLAILENHYGAKLIHRTTRSLNLTDEGFVLLERARQIVADAKDLKQTIQYGANRISGIIKISATHDFGRNRLLPYLDLFMDLHPEVKIHLHMSDAHIDLISERVDIAIRLGQLKDSALISRKLGTNRRVVCASPKYVKASGAPAKPSELEYHNCLLMRFNGKLDNDWDFIENRRRITVRVSGNRTANNGDVVKQWCLNGNGIALKSIWDVEALIKDGKLIELLSDYRSIFPDHLQAIYPGGGRPPRRVSALINFLHEKLSDEQDTMPWLN